MSQAANLDASELKFLITLFRTESLSITANTCAMSLSTASRRLQDAREIFGDQLFMRSGQKMFPTTKMIWLLPDIEKTLAMLEHLVDPRSFQPAENRRFYRIASLDCAFTMVLDAAITRCRKIAPGVSFQIVPVNTASFDDLRKGLLDLLVFGFDVPVREYIHKAVLGESTYALLFRQEHPLYVKFLREGSVTKEDIASFEPIAIRSAFSVQRPNVPMPWFGDERQEGNVALPYFLSAALSITDSDQLLLVPTPFARRLVEQIRGLAWMSFAAFTNRRWKPTIYWHERTHLEPEMQWLRGIIQSAVEF